MSGRAIYEGDILEKRECLSSGNYHFEGILDTHEQASNAVALMESYPAHYYRIVRPTDEYLSQLRLAWSQKHSIESIQTNENPATGEVSRQAIFKSGTEPANNT